MNRSDSRITIRRIDIMPSIKQNTAQQRALVNISSQLDAVKSMNDILSGEAKDTFIGFPSGSGRSRGIIKIPVEADSKEYQKLLRVVRDIRSRTVKEIQAQASKFNIEMDQSDMDILNGIASTESAVEAEEVEPEEAQQPEAEAPYEEEEHEEPSYQTPQPAYGGMNASPQQPMNYGGFHASEGVPEGFM